MASYTNDQRKAARTLYEQRGAKVASEQLHIPRRTITDWAAREGWGQRLTAVSGDGQQTLGQRQRAGWALRRQGLADDAAEAAHETVQLYMVRVRSGKIYGLLELARSFALFTERAAEMSAGLGGDGAGDQVAPEQALGEITSTLDAIESRVGTDG